MAADADNSDMAGSASCPDVDRSMPIAVSTSICLQPACPPKFKQGILQWFAGKVSPAFDKHISWPSPPKKKQNVAKWSCFMHARHRVSSAVSMRRKLLPKRQNTQGRWDEWTQEAQWWTGRRWMKHKEETQKKTKSNRRKETRKTSHVKELKVCMQSADDNVCHVCKD